MLGLSVHQCIAQNSIFLPWSLTILTRLCGVTNAQAFWFFRSPRKDSNYLKWMVSSGTQTYICWLGTLNLNFSQRSGFYGMKVNCQMVPCFSRNLYRLLDIVQMVLVAYSCYLYLVTNFTEIASVARMNWTLCVGHLFSVLILILTLLNYTNSAIYIYNGK